MAEKIVMNLIKKQRLLMYLKFELVEMEERKLKLKLPYSEMAK